MAVLKMVLKMGGRNYGCPEYWVMQSVGVPNIVPNIEAGGGVDEEVFQQHAAEKGVHAIIGVAHGHGTGGVTVVAVSNGEQFLAASIPLAAPVLHRHFDGDLHRDRA